MPYKLLGLDKLIVKMDGLDEAEITTLLDKASGYVVKDASSYVVDHKIGTTYSQTGRLAKSITAEVVDKEAYIGTNVYYAPYVHQGTGIYAANGDGRQTPWVYEDENGNYWTTNGMAPNPFLTDALQDNQDRIVKIFDDAVKEKL